MPFLSFAQAALLGAWSPVPDGPASDPFPLSVFQETVGIAVLLAAAIGMLFAALKTGSALARWKRQIVREWRLRKLSRAEVADLQAGVTVGIDRMEAALDELAAGSPRPLSDDERAAFQAYRRQLERFRRVPDLAPRAPGSGSNASDGHAGR
jgi:hypothetical protein